MLNRHQALRTLRKGCIPSIFILSAGLVVPAAANNYGESYGWQFRTTADRVNQAVILDLLEKRRSGYYNAPSYTTNIGRQYNCGVTANATGNSDSQTALANSPSVTGASSVATGNDATTLLNGGKSQAAQGNSGAVSSHIVGGTSASVHGAADQALNSSQTNSGSQAASIAGSAGCTFGDGQ
ncbi:hypothetical protein [Bosea sp. MMO-172]|uniref:hypothetical protein n=1 Tax=Bosea sp. MMO-172 TaxID=3127885 RepID=UPI003018E18C